MLLCHSKLDDQCGDTTIWQLIHPAVLSCGPRHAMVLKEWSACLLFFALVFREWR